jgi:hypothetical protein
MAQIFGDGDVIIPNDEITLTSFDGSRKLNIYNLVRSIDIYESLTNYTVSADIYIAEGIELINNFPMAGEERVSITLETPSRKSITYDFLVSKIDAQRSNDAGNLKSYVLRCVTEDLLKNSFKTFTKRYKDKRYTDALREVINQDLGSGLSVETEQTKGEFDFTVNNVRPFQVVDLICERAVSGEENISSTFFFYQDNQGYHFKTLEKLIKERRSGAQHLQFFYQTVNRAEDYEKVINVRNIIAYDTVTQGSSIEKVKSGGMRMRVHEFDIKTGEYYRRKDYINTSDGGKYEKLDGAEDFNSKAFNLFVTEMPAVHSMVIKDGTRPDMKHNENIHWKRPFVDKLKNYTMRARVYGDTTIRVGDVVTMNLPEITGAEGPDANEKNQKFYSGQYVIFNLKHRLDKRPSGVFDHFMVFEMKKTNILESIG